MSEENWTPFPMNVYLRDEQELAEFMRKYAAGVQAVSAPTLTDAQIDVLWEHYGGIGMGLQARQFARAVLNAAIAEDEMAMQEDAVNTLTEEGWTWDGDQWQRPAFGVKEDAK